MKRFLIVALIILGGVLQAPVQARNTRMESAVVQFDEPVKLLSVILKGKYLILHHEGMMAKGKPCTLVYTLDPEKQGRFVVSFHCRPVKREKANTFKVITSHRVLTDLPEIEEIQFAGTIEGHQVLRME